MGYTVNEETLRLHKESTALSQQAHKVQNQTIELWQEVQKKLIEHAELMLVLGELQTLSRLKDEELEEAVKRG